MIITDKKTKQKTKIQNTNLKYGSGLLNFFFKLLFYFFFLFKMNLKQR